MRRYFNYAILASAAICGGLAAWGSLDSDGKRFFAVHPSLPLNWVAYAAAGLLGLGTWELEKAKSRG